MGNIRDSSVNIVLIGKYWGLVERDLRSIGNAKKYLGEVKRPEINWEISVDTRISLKRYFGGQKIKKTGVKNVFVRWQFPC